MQKENRKKDTDITALALDLANKGTSNAAELLRQAEGKQRLKHKVPSWAALEELRYPARLALEQCSGEATARYKADVAQRLFPEGKAMADLTGGFGVDFSCMAPHFGQAVYVERQIELCRLARHNFPLLGLDNAVVVEGDGVDYLREMPAVDLLFLDPARRDAAGRKTVLIGDCEPDVAGLLPLLQEKAVRTMVKLSPMLDTHRAVEALGCVSEIHVVADGGECKELLLVLEREAVAEPRLYVAEGDVRFSLPLSEETGSVPSYAETLGEYLYEPGAAVMKAGIFKWIAVFYGLRKLHPNSHLYTSDEIVGDFPGRTFRISGTWGFSKQELRGLKSVVDRANLTVRNFPSTVADLRKRLKLKEGGDTYLFATTLSDGTHRLIGGRKVGAYAPKSTAF